MWEYSDKEYIKVFRKMLQWEWYTDSKTKALFLHCLLKANWKDTKWKGMVIKRGQFVTSLSSLSKETGLSIREVRTALTHLKTTNEVTECVTSKFRIITVLFYDEYQSSDKQKDKQTTNKRQTNDKQATTDIRIDKNRQEEQEEQEASPAPPAYENPWDEPDMTDEEAAAGGWT